MAFDIKNFAYISASFSNLMPRIFSYSTTDDLATVVADDYFLVVSNQLKQNDRMEVSSTVFGNITLIIDSSTSTAISASIGGFPVALNPGGTNIIWTTASDNIQVPSPISGSIIRVAATLYAGAITTFPLILTVENIGTPIAGATMTFEVGATILQTEFVDIPIVPASKVLENTAIGIKGDGGTSTDAFLSFTILVA